MHERILIYSKYVSAFAHDNKNDCRKRAENKQKKRIDWQ